jgi:sugar diacid utilization regulator
LKTAEALAIDSLAISTALTGNESLETASGVCRLGVILHAKGDFAGAQRRLDECLRIRVARLGRDHEDITVPLDNLARIAQDRRDFVDEAIGAVLRYDGEHGTALVATLRSWVAADYCVHAAAARLFVHPNTLKYRLKRIRTLLGGDPARGDLRLQVELALKLLELPRLSAAPPGGGPA